MPDNKNELSNKVEEQPSELASLKEQVSVLELRLAKVEGQVKTIASTTQTHPNSAKTIQGIDKIPVSENIRWRKLGGGTLRLKSGKIIKPRQVFEACLKQIPKGARDLVVPIGDDLPQEKPLQSSTDYRLEEKGAGWWNVINSETKKPINEKGLRKEDAEKLLQDLT